MSPPPIDLPHFKKKIRGKIRLAIFISRLLHLMYLAVKNYKNSPKQLMKYDSFLQLVSDRNFVMKVLAKESRFGKPEADPLKYLKLVNIMRERGYASLLELVDVIWDLTIHHNRIDHRTLFNNIVGLPSSEQFSLDIMKFIGKVSYRPQPFIMNINQYNYIIVEAELGERTEALAKTLVYIGSLAGANKSLGLFARFSVRSIDAEYMLLNQNKGYIHRLLKTFRFYPTVLRMQRLAYKKVKAVKELESEALSVLSELYIDNNKFISLISMDVPANILAMAPSISLNGGLCFVTAFRGELLNILGTEREAGIKVADVVIKAYPSYYSVLQYQRYPGDYVFVSFHPFTIPRIGLIVATYPVDILDKLKPKRRNISSLDKLFPKVQEVVKAHS